MSINSVLTEGFKVVTRPLNDNTYLKSCVSNEDEKKFESYCPKDF